MQRSIHRSACAVLALIALSLTGVMTQCPWYKLSVEIPDFETSQVQGLDLWRADDEVSQIYSEAGRIVFGDRFFEDGSEKLEYMMLDSQNQPLECWGSATVIREAGNDDAVTLQFIFAGWTEPPGWIRASSFNAVGESELSEQAIVL